MSEREKDPAGDIAALRALKFDEDARTISEMIAEDEYEDVTVEKAEREGERTTISWNGGTTTSVKGPEVKVGDTVRFYGSAQLGGSHHGWALNGKVIEWKTPWERFAERVAWLAKYDRDKRERFERERESLDERVGALPWPLRKRIERFRQKDPKFRVDSEAYEMMAAGDAPTIAQALASEKGWPLDEDMRADAPPEDVEQVVKAFMDAGHDEQRRRVPDLGEGHSGNTFGGAVRLAYGLLVGQEL